MSCTNFSFLRQCASTRSRSYPQPTLRIVKGFYGRKEPVIVSSPRKDFFLFGILDNIKFSLLPQFSHKYIFNHLSRVSFLVVKTRVSVCHDVLHPFQKQNTNMPILEENKNKMQSLAKNNDVKNCCRYFVSLFKWGQSREQSGEITQRPVTHMYQQKLSYLYLNIFICMYIVFFFFIC